MHPIIADAFASDHQEKLRRYAENHRRYRIMRAAPAGETRRGRQLRRVLWPTASGSHPPAWPAPACPDDTDTRAFPCGKNQTESVSISETASIAASHQPVHADVVSQPHAEAVTSAP